MNLFQAGSGGKTSRIFYAVAYSASDIGYKCPSDGFYFIRAKSNTAGTDVNVSIKRNGTSYQVTTVKQPSNTNIYPPLVCLFCSANDIVTSSNASAYQLYKLCADTDEHTL